MKNNITRKALYKDIDQIWDLGSNIEVFQVSNEVVTFWPKDVLASCINRELFLNFINNLSMFI